MITISVCMIVKNVEKILKRCLDSLAGLWEELIIVDTGSTDKTKEIAAGYTDGIDVTYGWINSEGHRSNLLFEAVKYLGVGISSTYYTQVFYTPMQ